MKGDYYGYYIFLFYHCYCHISAGADPVHMRYIKEMRNEMYNAHIITIDSDVILHNISFARYDQRNREFVFIGRTKDDTVRIGQERVISIEFGKDTEE